MRLWLDDVRPAPEGWHHVRTAEEAIAAFATGKVLAASLDHDLGPVWAGTGYDVLVWVEKAIGERAWYGPLPRIDVHSANPVGRSKMVAAVKSINGLYEELGREEFDL